jgi:hypothetical protein
MPARWSADRVLALALDVSSQRAAAALAGAPAWSDCGSAGDLVWGLCAGSGQRPYEVAVDLVGPAFKCSCPSRKVPCKHVLALLLSWADSAIPERTEPAGYARAWKASRDAWAARPAGVRTVKDDAAAARRAGQRSARVAAGLAELQVWLRDQIRTGISGAAAGGYRYLEPVAARMVDAQAPGVASTLRRLSAIPASGDGWPGRLLAEYALLHLLARAHDCLDALPPGLAAVVRSRVGYTTSREDVLARPAVTDRWQVLAVRDLLDAPIPARRVWLRGRESDRFALLLSFAVNGNFTASPDASLAPGTEVQAEVHFYPGQPPLRAVIGKRHAARAAATGPGPASSIAALLDDWAAALAQDPWLTEWPVLLSGTPLMIRDAWYLADGSGSTLPLVSRESVWTLLAISGGRPVAVAGEWGPAGLTALTAWHGDLAVPL